MGMMKVPYVGVLSVPFNQLLANPMLVLNNLPRVDSVVKSGDLDYLVTSTPYVFHFGLIIVGKCHVNLDVVDNMIIWSRSNHHCDLICNGCVEGVASLVNHNDTHVQGSVSMSHPGINAITSPVLQPIAKSIGNKLVGEFEQNFHDAGFSNQVEE